MSTGSVQADVSDEGILVPGPSHPLMVRVNGIYVFSFDPERDGRPHNGGLLIEWPLVLHKYLDGHGQVTVCDVTGTDVVFDGPVTLGTTDQPLAIVDNSGHPLSVDKVGHLCRSFSDTSEEIRNEILVGTQRALEDLREACGVNAYLNYGALLGAVRDGAMIAHDSDTDLCYVSKHESPADIIAESYMIERNMTELGWNVLRMSGGDVKLLLPLSDGRNCHIDIFSAFWCEGTFFQFGNRSGKLAKESLLPLGTIEMHGFEFPAPRDPEAMLAFLYGENWRVPDPSFTYADPHEGVRRLNGWFRGFRSHMGGWAEFHDGPGREVRNERSPFAVWVHDQIGADDAVAEVGSGAGQDSLWYLQHGHPVRTYDYSRMARKRARLLARENDVDLNVSKLILGEVRTVLAAGADLARHPHHITARLLLGALEPHERENFWRMCRMALRGHGNSLFLEFSARVPGMIPEPWPHRTPEPPQPSRLVHRVSPRMVRREVEAAGGVIEHMEIGPGLDLVENTDPAVCRVRVTFPSPQERAAAAAAAATSSEETQA